MLRKKIDWLLIVWIGILLLLFFYSFTQIDLGLTLTRASWWQTVQRSFQQIGYFQRPLSTKIYLFILLFLFGFYFLILKKVKEGKLNSRQIWRLIFLTAGILWLAYNAFSHDLFNYIFYGKIMTFYRQNPYRYKALDFPGDPMLGFMHWTHNVYPYGPAWLLFTVPLSFLSFQKLIPNMILFKGLAVAGYLGLGWFIYKILDKTNPEKKLMGLAFFAFSPLVIIEGLVSAHNDIFMMALALAGLWFLFKKRPWLAWLMLGLSVGVKFATAFLLPVFIWLSFCHWRKKKVNWSSVWLACLGLMTTALLAASWRSELKPWYLFYVLPFAALLTKKSLFWLTTIFSLGALLHYAPFLYLGNWDPPVPAIKLWLTIIFLLVGVVVGSRSFLLSRKSDEEIFV